MLGQLIPLAVVVAVGLSLIAGAIFDRFDDTPDGQLENLL